MSFLGIGSAAQGSSRSRSRSRTRAKDEDSNAPYQMSGALSGAANYTTAQPTSNNPPGYGGVQFAKPLVPTYSSNNASIGAPGQQAQQFANSGAGAYQYAAAPIKYSSRPVINPSKITPIANIVETKEERKKKKEKERDSSSSPELRPSRRALTERYETMTIGPGKKPSKKKKKDDDNDDDDPYDFLSRVPSATAQPYANDRYSRMPSPPSSYGMAAPDHYPIGTQSRTPIMTPGSYPIDSAEERAISTRGHSYGDHIEVRDIAPRSSSPTKSKSKSSKSHRLSTAGLQPDLHAPSSAGFRGRTSSLSVGGDSYHAGGGMPPPSPMLESYRGTYQSMPGFPSPMIRGRDEYDDFDVEVLEPLDAPAKKKKEKDKDKSKSSKSGSSLTVMKISGRDSSRTRSRSRSRVRSKSPKKKTVSMYQAEQDAKLISSELVRTKPDFRVLTDVLPGLSHDQIIELHAAYKSVAKYQGKGINIAKHIKLKVPSHLRTIAYVTALGRWESEGYWANYWYQSAVSKRELLIESLMGRSNFEMQMIKEGFRDKRYGDSLIKCMDKELKVDKFRSAAMHALEANRQEENEVFPAEYVEKDVDTWIRALKGRSGGESAMLEICVTRSDLHLKKCLRLYEREQGGNFAKQALARSENLVGEVLAHILNGVINRPARDAMLLHHALLDLKPRLKDRQGSESSSDERSSSKREKERQKKKEKEKEREDRKDRYELLISRVVRFHWDRAYMERVKNEYRDKFDSYVEDDVEDWLKEGEFREFVLELLQTD